MSKKDDRKKQKKRRKEEKKAAERRQLQGRLKSLIRKLSKYPDVEWVEDEGDPEFIAIVKEAQLKIDLDAPDQCTDTFRRAYQAMRTHGISEVIHGFQMAGGSDPMSQHNAYIAETQFGLHYGQLLFRHIPIEVRKAYLPYNDVMVFYIGDRFVPVFSSLLKAKSKGGTIYYSRRKPLLTIAGQRYPVGFSEHSIERAVLRLNPNYLNYEASYDVHCFFANCLYHEHTILDSPSHPDQNAFCMYNRCGTPHYKSYQTYVNNIYGLNGKEPDHSKGEFHYRLGYFPFVIDNGFAKATTFLRPGYSGTPERNLLHATELPHELKRFLIKEAGEQIGREVTLADRVEVIEWFHRNGIPQVMQFKEPLFDTSPPQRPQKKTRFSAEDHARVLMKTARQTGDE
jgi:hypothetical protein